MSNVEAQPVQPALGIRIGAATMLIGLLAIVGTLASSFSRPASTTAHGAILFLSSLCVLGGLVACAASWIVWKQAQHTHALGERHELTAAKVDAVNEVVRQLTAAPTVNLLELRQMVRQQGDELQEKVLMGHTMVARRFTDVIKEGIQEVNLRVKDLEADLASFRLSQQASAEASAKTNGTGRVGVLRSLPSKPD